MNTKFNSQELLMIQDKIWFEHKASASAKTVALLEELGSLMKINSRLICLEQEASIKITKGENLKGFPYFVLDAPGLKAAPDILSFRIIIWWCNYITVNLILGEEQLNIYRKKLIENIGLIKSGDFYMGIAENLWQHEVYDEAYYIEGKRVSPDLINELKILKITAVIPLNSKEILKELMDTVSALNAILI